MRHEAINGAAARRWMALAAAVLAAALAGGAGCQSTQAPKLPRKNQGVIVVSNAAPGQIQRAVERVFGDDDFTVLESLPTRVVMEKPAGKMSDILYGGWFDGPVWVRVTTDIRSWTGGAHLLECQGTIIRDRGNAAFEEEITRYRIKSKPFQDYLDRVRLDLQRPAAGP